MTSDDFGAIVRWIDRPVTAGTLNGLRVGVKDLLAVAGVPRLCGAGGIIDDRPQDADAAAVARVADAGAAIVATTTTHQLGFGVTTPSTANPRAPGRIAGGSSGGAAAALAAGLIDGAVATDSAGSVRIPAACCGVVGFKPRDGHVPRDGLAALASSFDTVGPMARDIATVVALHRALTRSRPSGSAAGAREKTAGPPRTRLRVGVVTEVRDAAMDVSVRQTWDAVLDLLAGAGASVVEVSVPLWDQAHPAHGRILAAEALAEHAQLLDRAGDLLDPDVRAGLEAARRLPPERVLEARRTAAIFRDRLQGVFAAADVLVLPTLPCEVPAVGAERVTVDGEDERLVSALTRLTDPWNLAGVPAGSVPAGRDASGAPIGVQVVGPWQADVKVLATMGEVESLMGGPWPPIRSPAGA